VKAIAALELQVTATMRAHEVALLNLHATQLLLEHQRVDEARRMNELRGTIAGAVADLDALLTKLISEGVLA
jgi:hypothetical protein